MLGFAPEGASEVALSHHCLDCSRSAFVVGATVSVTAVSSAFGFFLLGIMAAAESISSMTMQPLVVERQKIRLMKRIFRMPSVSPYSRKSLNCVWLAHQSLDGCECFGGAEGVTSPPRRLGSPRQPQRLSFVVYSMLRAKEESAT